MEDEDPLECPLHVGDLVRVSDEYVRSSRRKEATKQGLDCRKPRQVRPSVSHLCARPCGFFPTPFFFFLLDNRGKAFSKRLKDRDAGLGRVRKVSDDGLVIDVEWVLGGRWIGLRRRDLVRRTAVQEGYTEQRKRQRPTTLLQDTFTVPSSTAAAAVAATPIASAVAVVPSPPSTTKRTPANKKTGTPKTGKVTPKRTSSSSSSKSTAAKRKRATTTTTTTKKKVAASGEPTSSNGGCTNGATIRVTTGAPAHHHSPDGDNGGVADGPVGCAPPPPHHELYERHKREFERVVARLEKVDKFGFFLDQAPPEYEENYDQPPSRPLSLSLLSQPPHTQQQSTTTTTTAEGGGASEATSSSVGLAVPSTVAAPGGVPLVVAGDSTSTGVMASTVAVDADEEQPKPAKRRRKVGGVGGGLDFSGSGATIFPSHAPFNWAMIRRRMEKGRYVWRRESARPRRIGMKRKAWPLLHRLGVHWPLFLSDVNAMCDAALERDDEDNDENDAEGDAAAAVKDGEHRMTVTAVDTVRSPARIEKGSLLYAVRQVKEAVRLAYERTGCRQMAELSAADDRHKFATAVQSHTNTEAAMQTWRQTPFPERKYERLETGDAVCAGLSPVDERIAAYELRTHLPESFVGLSYRYDDTGQSEAWMKSVVDETGGNGATATSPRARGEGLKDAGTGAAATAASTEDEAREAALALAADNGVIRAQVAASMSSLLIAVQDKVMTETGVLKQPELKSANWCSDRENHPTDAKPEVVEKPVWGIDCYTRRNILVCLETDFDAAVALQFVEKWLLPAINACPDHLASDVANAARLLEDVPFEEEPTIGGEASVGAEPTPTSHTLLRAALAEKIRKSAPRWLKGAANQLRRAREALGADFFRVHPKGHGSILLCPSVKANSMVTFYRGELYPSWRWGEKMDAIDITQQRKDLKPALPDFYNMMLERPQSDPRGYGLLFVDATRKAGHGSSLSHSCDPTCEVRVASVNGVLCLAMTTLRALEMGEELTFDYNAVTESLNEYRSAVCLCGHHRCRGSFLHFATADCYQQVLNRNAPVATRFANLVKGSMKKVMSEDDDRVLRNHGFLTAAFGAISVNRRQDPGCMDCDSLDFVPVWLRTFVADTLRYIEYERRALPISLICDHLASLKDSEEEEVGPELLQREPSKAQPSFFYFTRTQSDFVNSLMKKEGIPDTLIGIQRRQAFNKIAANYWQALPDEKKEYWKQQSTIEFEARLKAWRTANTKSSKSSSAKKQKKGDPKKPAIGDLLLSSKMSFQDADAEGISAMEQRIQQLTQCLSRIGRVLDRHREWSFEHEVVNNSGNCYTAQTLRERVHSPIQIASDDVVVGWIWNAQDGPVTALMAAAESSRWARPNLSEKLVKVRSKYVELVAFGDPTTINPGTIESASGVDAIKARTKLKSALLEIRSILLQELKQMGKLYRQYKSLQRLELEKSNDEDGNEGQSLDGDDTLEDAPQSQGTSELQDCRDVDVAQHDAVGIDDAPATHLYEGFQSSPSLVSEGVNPSTSFTSSPSVDKMLPKDATTDERPSANARSTAIASPPTAQSLVEANPWLEHIHERFVMCAVADLLLLYAHTTNFFLMQPYKALTSTPIEVYARELGNAVPRSAMDVDSEDFAEVSNLASQANEVKDHIGRKGKELNGRSMKGSSPEICEPDDIISNVTVRYNGDYVLSQLLQWYNGGIGQKPGLPDLMGCAVLPSIQGCFASEMLVSSRSKTDKKTTYETKIRSRLLEWLQDPYQRGGPWPDDVRKAFAPSDDNRLKGDTSSQWLPFGSPILDFLVTGDESNIQDALEELDGDRKATTKGKPGSLLLSVDKGRPAQAVSNWVQCENPSCLKWRKIPWHVDIDLLPEKFYCSINKWDPKGNSCDAPEDDWDEDDKLVGGDGKVEGSPVRKDPNAALCPSLEANFFVGGRLHSSHFLSCWAPITVLHTLPCCLAQRGLMFSGVGK